MLPTDAVIADHVLALYGYAGGPTVDWAYMEDRNHDDGVCFAIAELDGYQLVVFEGTSTLRDDLRDFVVFPVRVYDHARLGPLHFGMWDGMAEAWSVLKPRLKLPAIMAGHSLGAAHAAIACGLATLDKVPVAYSLRFGEPRVGTLDLAGTIQHIPQKVLRNKGDIIPWIPSSTPLFRCVPSYPETEFNKRPGLREFRTMGPFAWHHMGLYRKACA